MHRRGFLGALIALVGGGRQVRPAVQPSREERLREHRRQIDRFMSWGSGSSSIQRERDEVMRSVGRNIAQLKPSEGPMTAMLRILEKAEKR